MVIISVWEAREDEIRCPSSVSGGREKGQIPLSFAFYSIQVLHSMDNAHPTMGRIPYFTESTDSHASLIRKHYHKHTQTWCFSWSTLWPNYRIKLALTSTYKWLLPVAWAFFRVWQSRTTRLLPWPLRPPKVSVLRRQEKLYHLVLEVQSFIFTVLFVVSSQRLSGFKGRGTLISLQRNTEICSATFRGFSDEILRSCFQSNWV